MTAVSTPLPGHRPLYQQVRDLLLTRIASGEWQPAKALPSEQALAQELGVSQGTVRKSLDALVADQLLERRQGKGTFVAQHTNESTNFRFFRLNDASQKRIRPNCLQASIEKRRPQGDEATLLSLKDQQDVFSIGRVRHYDGNPILQETIVVPADLFPTLDQHQPLPNALYTLYQREFDVSVSGAKEKVRAVSASTAVSRDLGVAEATPILLVERVAVDIANRPVELRRSHYRTDECYYEVELS